MSRNNLGALLRRIPHIEPCRPVAVFSVNFGDYDTTKPVNPGGACDFILFTDSKGPVPLPWRKAYVDSEGFDVVLLSKLIKALSHVVLFKYQATLYIDASFVLIRPIDELLALMDGSDVSLFKHPSRVCVYEEARQCLAQNRGKSSQIVRQVQRYRSKGVPENVGLFAGGVIYRNHQIGKVREINETWADELCCGSLRDQLSLAVVLWRYDHQVAVNVIPGNVFWNKYLIPTPHSRSSVASKCKWHLKALAATGIKYPLIVRRLVWM